MGMSALLFWCIGYWVLLGTLHDQEEEGIGFTLVQLAGWLFYPVLLPLLLIAGAVQRMADYRFRRDHTRR